MPGRNNLLFFYSRPCQTLRVCMTKQPLQMQMFILPTDPSHNSPVAAFSFLLLQQLIAFKKWPCVCVITYPEQSVTASQNKTLCTIGELLVVRHKFLQQRTEDRNSQQSHTNVTVRQGSPPAEWPRVVDLYVRQIHLARLHGPSTLSNSLCPS